MLADLLYFIKEELTALREDIMKAIKDVFKREEK